VTIGVRRQAFVDLSALVENFAHGATPPAETLADVRADAYGHGLVAVALALAEAGAPGFLVSSTADVAALAAVGITAARVHPGDPLASAVAGPALYGFGPTTARPTFRLVGEVIAKATTLALVALGFADGIPRVASNRAPVKVGDFVGRVTGRIAMDQFVVDLDGNTASVGDHVVLFGDPARGEPSLAQWADATGLAADVIVSGLGSRIERIYA
jgi:alanine racemase